MTLSRLFLCSPVLILLAACSDDSNFNFDADIEQTQLQFEAVKAAEALFNPAQGIIPFPSNFVFAGSQDGTLNIPPANGLEADDLTEPFISLNTLDGFSTIEPVTASFSREINPDSVVLGSTVKVFEASETNPQTNAVETLGAELTAQDMAVAVAGVPAVLSTPLVITNT